jgi:NitT/TauT family transport system ATP-binding protein
MGSVASRQAEPAPVAPPLVAERVSKTYDDGWHEVPVIADLSFTLDAGTIVSIVGPSGCGKTTLLNTLSGLIEPTGGTISWHGQPLRGMPPRVGYMLQKDLLFPWRTALANVTLGLEIAGVGRADAQDRAHALLDQLGLNGFATHYPATLSGGMRQRVALARTLVNDPEVLLLDEPFAALDEITRRALADDIHRLWASTRPAVVFVTHNVEEAVYMASRVVVMTPGPGRTALEAAVDAPLPRPEGFRTTPLFRTAVEQVSAALMAAMAGAA